MLLLMDLPGSFVLLSHPAPVLQPSSFISTLLTSSTKIKNNRQQVTNQRAAAACLKALHLRICSVSPFTVENINLSCCCLAEGTDEDLWL